MEMRRSFSRKLFVGSLQQLIPELTEADVVPLTQTGGSLTHRHHFTTDGHLHWTKSNGSLFDPPVAPTQDITREKDSGTTDGPDTVPVPYYALAYIMKL